LVTQSEFHTATLLNNGKVLIVGGQFTITPAGGGPSAPELYDPATGFFSATGSLNVARIQSTSTLLSDGTVLVGGGTTSTGDMEIYNPATGTFATTVSHTANFSYQTMTLLNNGKVLVAGGYDSCLNGCATPYLNSAELFDPVSRVFSPTGSLSVVRAFATAVLLNDGSVLVVGGGNAAGQAGTAEVYDASSGVFTAAGAMETTRSGNTATLLTDGTVLIVGGAGPLASAELYESTPLVPSSLQVTPTAVTMQVGNTRQFTAVDNHGNPVPMLPGR
jgi:hypothetical protein